MASDEPGLNLHCDEQAGNEENSRWAQVHATCGLLWATAKAVKLERYRED